MKKYFYPLCAAAYCCLTVPLVLAARRIYWGVAALPELGIFSWNNLMLLFWFDPYTGEYGPIHRESDKTLVLGAA